MLINKSFKAKSLYRFGTSLSFHDSLQRDPVSFIIPHLNLLAGEFDNLLLILLYWVIYILTLYQSKINSLNLEILKCICNTLTVPCEKSKIVYLTSLKMKTIHGLPAQSRFPAELICWIALGSVLSTCCLLKSSAINLYIYFFEIRII